jgi:hypothetical protein
METAREILEAWKKKRKAEAFLEQDTHSTIRPTPTEIKEELLDFITLGTDQLVVEIWNELCDLIDKYGETKKFKEWLLEGGKEQFWEDFDKIPLDGE